MEPKRYERLMDASKFQGKLSYMHMRIEGHLLPEGKVDLKFSTLSGLRINIYPTG